MGVRIGRESRVRMISRPAVGLIAALAVFIAAGTASAAEPVRIDGRIVAVADGDTLTLLDATKTQHKIRLDGIDAPEKGQAFGNRSKQSLSDLAFGREAQAHCPKVDRYNRRVCKVIVNGADVGLEQIKRGMAWAFVRYLKELEPERREAYIAAEANARAEKRGLWRDSDPMPPWEWRDQHRRGK